ncbi:glycosyl transferase [Bernardetia litoralis DSM 6794]|uniref:Glycosyl transferase n=1 Tax=Bernardetia litoralis (strain ATCC 23117 / DSM 6794 / NBRC 15988 / NCIMB 1366 / Fx l1 / Sio-4) TaxID=880071 RepID=I4AGF8_BERLS|nr:glycosyl transferase [Bernardetia litoralis DSM 6794]
MLYLTIIILWLYVLTLFTLIYGWHNKPTFIPKQASKNKIRFSILIPVRNEAQNIATLLNDLSLQNLDKSNFEVLVLDDNSDDETAQIVKDLIAKMPYSLQLISVPAADSAHKKRAITLGVSRAKFEYIITTDGDCRVKKSWLSTFSNFIFHKEKTDKKALFVAGAVRLNHKRDFFAALQAAEFATLIGCGGAALNLGFPFTCNGANMAYSKKLFEKMGGYENKSDRNNEINNGYQISSGDDEFLLHKFYKNYPKNIFFLKSDKAIVETEAAQSWKQFYNQRKRWASKWNQHKKISHAAISIFVFLIQVFTLLMFIFISSDALNDNSFLINSELKKYLYLTFFIKMSIEFLFLSSILFFLKQLKAILTLPFWWFFYSFYAIFFGLVAQKKGYQWKGRKTK